MGKEEEKRFSKGSGSVSMGSNPAQIVSG